MAKAVLDYIDSGENTGFFSPLDVLLIQNMRSKIEQDYRTYLASQN